MLVKIRFDGQSGAARTYTYNWQGPDSSLQAGDRVVVPANFYSDEAKFATVDSLGSDYEGPVKDLLGVVRDNRVLRPDGEELS